jgi:hypothetical protein
MPGLAFGPDLDRTATNRGDLRDDSVGHLHLSLAGHWSSYLVSNIQQPSMAVSLLPRGDLGMNACSAGSLPPIDSTVVSLRQWLESEQYTTDSGA